MSTSKKSRNVRFVLEIDGYRSVIDSTLPREALKKMILEEVETMFKGDFSTCGEDRFVDKTGFHLKGRYLDGLDKNGLSLAKYELSKREVPKSE